MQATPSTATTNKLKTALKTSNTPHHSSNLSPKSPTTLNTKPYSNDPSDEIEEISKKISEHADAIYRTWKSRGLAPEKLLDFYANATADGAVGETTAAVDFFAATTATETAGIEPTDGLQKLVSSFVLKDKEQRGVKMLKKPEVKAMTKTTPAATTTGTALAGNEQKLTQKKATTNKGTQKIQQAITTNTVTTKAADGIAQYAEAAAAAAVASAPKTTKIGKPSAKAATSTAITTITSVNAPTTKTTASAKKKLLLDSAESAMRISNNNNNNSTDFNNSNNNYKSADKTTAINAQLENANMPAAAKTTTTTAISLKNTTTAKPNINVDINLNLDVNNLSQLQTNNLLKIKELLQQEEKESAKKMQQKKPSTHEKSAMLVQQQEQQKTQDAVSGAGFKTKTTTKATTTASVGNVNSTYAPAGSVTGNAAIKTATTTNNVQNKIGNKQQAATITTEPEQPAQANRKLVKNSNAKSTMVTKLKANQEHDVVDIANSQGQMIDKSPLNSMITIITTTATTPTTTNKVNTNTKRNNATATPTLPTTIATMPTLATTISLATLSSTLTPYTTAAAASNNTTQATATATPLLATQSSTLKSSTTTKAKPLKNSEIVKDICAIQTIDTTAATTTTTPLLTKTNSNSSSSSSSTNNSTSSNNKRSASANATATATAVSAESGMEVARSTMPTPTKVKAGRAALTNGQDKNLGRPILTRGSVAERVLMFEKCPDVRNSFLNIKRPQQVDEPPKSLLKIKLHATPPPPPDQNSLQREIRSSKSVYIPRFYFPHGKPQPQIALERTLRGILSAFDSFPNNQVTKDELPRILKLCGIPFYWRMPVMVFCQQGNSGLVERQRFVEFWKQMNVYCHDASSRFIYILSRGQRFRQYILPEDFVPLVQDVVDTHPGLAFLKEATEFHSRYVHTVIARIFYSVNRSWSGKITMSELKKSDLLEIIQLLEEEDDINQIMAFFSYEHFYVIYCKFWELDKDHDLLINQDDLARHSDHALSQRIVERIFSGCVTRNDHKKEPDEESKMTYTEFVWFLLSEEDKRTPTAIEYWFRCMDIDGDGLLSMYELEYFYEEQQQRMESIGIETLPFEDCLCQMLDMIKPARRDCISLGDLKRCKMTHVFFDTFFNLEKYLDHEQRDPFATQRDEYSSDWDRFAAQEYELLITEENE